MRDKSTINPPHATQEDYYFVPCVLKMCAGKYPVLSHTVTTVPTVTNANLFGNLLRPSGGVDSRLHLARCAPGQQHLAGGPAAGFQSQSLRHEPGSA